MQTNQRIAELIADRIEVRAASLMLPPMSDEETTIAAKLSEAWQEGRNVKCSVRWATQGGKLQFVPVLIDLDTGEFL